MNIEGLTEKQKQLAKELSEFENTVDKDDYYPAERKAMMYVCLAHDWYEMDLEEEGNRLLIKANKVCPGYFSGPVIEHIKEDKGFNVIIKNLTFRLLSLLNSTLKDRCE